MPVNLSMARGCGSYVLWWVMPPRVPSAFSEQFATLRFEMSNRVATFHAAIFSSSNSSPAALIITSRFTPNASRKLTDKVSNGASSVASWQSTPGISPIQPIHRSPSFFPIAVPDFLLGAILLKLCRSAQAPDPGARRQTQGQPFVCPASVNTGGWRRTLWPLQVSESRNTP